MAARLLLLLLLPVSCSSPPSPEARAAAWLAAQEEEGLWKSRTTTLLGSGQVLTPFVLYALSHLPEAEREPWRGSIARGLGRLPVEGAEYPAYALTLSILAVRRLDPGRDVAPWVKRLRAMQLTEDLGWSPDDSVYGGWDHGAVTARKPQRQRPDLSLTAFACEAVGGDPRARTFAERCRAADGGFFFTPDPLAIHLNKAGSGVSTATATCDALGILGEDARARKWLVEHPALPAEPWAEAVFFYHAAARARIMPSKELAASVRARQHPDGSFRNPNALMKEDDPLVATGLALIALGRCH